MQYVWQLQKSITDWRNWPVVHKWPWFQKKFWILRYIKSTGILRWSRICDRKSRKTYILATRGQVSSYYWVLKNFNRPFLGQIRPEGAQIFFWDWLKEGGGVNIRGDRSPKGGGERSDVLCSPLPPPNGKPCYLSSKLFLNSIQTPRPPYIFH